MATILVTGASTGIGRACALDLDIKGHTVYAGVRTDTDAEKLASDASDRLVPLILDVTKQEHIDQAVARISHDVGSLDGLVNNAGIAVGGALEFLDVEDWRRQLEVNVIAQVAMTKAALPLILPVKGRIVFIGSIAGRVGNLMLAPYAASKHAVEGINWALRGELAPFGVKVAVIEPGTIKTEIWEKGRDQLAELEASVPAEARTRYRWHIDLMRKAIDTQDRRAAPPQKVADAVHHALFAQRPRTRYLVGPDAKFLGNATRVLPDRVIDWITRHAV